MSSKDLSSQAFSFKYQEFFKPGFIWYRDEAVAFVKEHYTVQLLLPAELLRQYPHYSASYNGFIEIPAGICTKRFITQQHHKKKSNRPDNRFLILSEK